MPIDLDIRDIKPVGATLLYASPEQLRSLQYQWQGNETHDDLLINGHASDMFSAGFVLYEALTGKVPFQPEEDCADTAPESVPLDLRDMWEEYESMLASHQAWVSTQTGKVVASLFMNVLAAFATNASCSCCLRLQNRSMRCIFHRHLTLSLICTIFYCTLWLLLR